jgi:hypothetical protein
MDSFVSATASTVVAFIAVFDKTSFFQSPEEMQFYSFYCFVLICDSLIFSAYVSELDQALVFLYFVPVHVRRKKY